MTDKLPDKYCMNCGKLLVEKVVQFIDTATHTIQPHHKLRMFCSVECAGVPLSVKDKEYLKAALK